jgi:hypothetical protein
MGNKIGSIFALLRKEVGDPTHYNYHGTCSKGNMLVRKYNGYEIGIYYFLDSRTGKP